MKKIISSDKAPKAVGPYNQAVEANGFVFMSGQIPVNPASGKIDATGIEAQARQVLENIGNVLKAAGCDYSNVIKSTVYLTDLANFQQMNGIYQEYFKVDPPARSTIQISALPLGSLIEIECVAVKS